MIIIIINAVVHLPRLMNHFCLTRRIKYAALNFYHVLFNTMSELKNFLNKADASQLHAATCLAITQFSTSKQCPCLANRIVLMLQYLLTHPDLPLSQDGKELYLVLLEHWQRVHFQLLLQKQADSTPVFH